MTLDWIRPATRRWRPAAAILVLAGGLAAAGPQLPPAGPATDPYVALGIRVARAALEEGPEPVRECAWKGLVRIDLQEALQLLEQGIRDPNRQIRIAAARALRERRDPLVLPIVEQEMKAHTWRVRADAMRDYASIAGDEALPTLRAALVNTRQPSLVRAAAADGLGILRAAEAVGDLIPLIESDQDNLRLHAILALGEIGAAAAVPPLLEHLEDLDDPHEEALTGRALALCGDAQGIAMMETDLRSFEPRNRLMARQTLMQRGRSLALRAYRRVLPRARPAAQVELIVAIAEAGDRGSLPVLRDMLSGDDPYVAQVAAAALAQFGDHSGYQILRDGLRESGWSYGDPVRHLLSGVDDRAVGYLVQEPFRRGDPAERFWAATILSRLGLAAADRFLERTAGQNDSPFRRPAAAALARRGDWSALPVLVERLGEDCASGSDSELTLLAAAPPDDTMPQLELYTRRGSPLERINAAIVLLDMVGKRTAAGAPVAGAR